MTLIAQFQTFSSLLGPLLLLLPYLALSTLPYSLCFPSPLHPFSLEYLQFSHSSSLYLCLQNANNLHSPCFSCYFLSSWYLPCQPLCLVESTHAFFIKQLSKRSSARNQNSTLFASSVYQLPPNGMWGGSEICALYSRIQLLKII